MSITKTFLFAAVLTLGCTFVASAALINVDGDLSDSGWAGAFVGSSPEDPEIDDGYDIKFTKNVWDADTWLSFFSVETWGPLTGPVGGNFVALLIDTDNDSTSGCPKCYSFYGAEYRVIFDLSYGMPGSLAYGSFDYGGNYNLQQYDAGQSKWIMLSDPGSGLLVSRGSAYGGYGVEFGVNGALLGNPGLITWGIHLDDAGDAKDDYVTGQRGEAPEPATLALFALGLGGLYLRRRAS